MEAWRKQFSDGTQVYLTIRTEEGGLAVRSEAEHRTSGPSEALVGKVGSLAAARKMLSADARDWDKHFAHLD